MLKLRIILTASAIALVTTVSMADELKFSSVWIKSGPPTAKILAGYLVVENPNQQPVTLQAFRSPQFKAIEMHETVIDAGMARMRPVTSIQIPAAGRIEFKPGGLHLMFLEPRGTVKTGDKIILVAETLTKGLGEIKIEAIVKDATSKTDHSHHH